MSEQKYCESCGMPLRSKKDYGGGKSSNKYCVYCCDAEGNLKSYKEVLEGMKNFMMKNMGVTEEQALKTAKEGMAKLPAWQERRNDKKYP